MTAPVVAGRLHPLSVLLFSTGLVRNALPAVLALWISSVPRWAVVAALAAAVVLGIPYGLLRWWRFRYQVVDGRLEVDGGVLVRHRRVMPLERIRAVSLDEPPVHRLLGLTRARIEAAAAGSVKSELALSAVSRSAAVALQRAVDGHRAGSSSGDPIAATPAPPPMLHRASPGMLLLAGAISLRYTLVPIGLVGGVWGTLGDFGLDGLAERTVRRLDGAVPHGTTSVALTLTLLAIVVLIAGALGSLISDFGFRLSADPRRLVTERGLLSRRSTTANRARVQGVEVTQSLPARAFRVAAAGAAVGGLAASDESVGGGRLRLVPLAPRDATEAVAETIVPGQSAALVAHPPAARTRRISRAVAIPAAALVVSAVLQHPWLVAGSALACVAMIAVGLDRARSLGHAATGGVVVTRHGSFVRRRSALDSASPVAISVRSTPWQRRRGLREVRIHMGLGVGSRRIIDLGVDQVGPVLDQVSRWAVSSPGNAPDGSFRGSPPPSSGQRGWIPSS